MHSIYHIEFPTQYLMSATMMRVAEHYESPRFRDTIFTHEEFMDWYASQRDGDMSYFRDWAGYNIPSKYVEEFMFTFQPFTEKERKMINLVRKNARGQYYLIATSKEEPTTLLHEVVHGLFTLYPRYALDVQLVLKDHDMSSQHEALMEMGYSKAVLDDEVNAYATTGLCPGLSSKKFKPIRPKLNKLILKHFGVKIDTPSGRKKLLSSIHNLKW